MPGLKKGANKETSMTGKAGEFMVAAQLLQRGLNISFPAVDNGVDIIAENGCRVQVKTARLRNSTSMIKMYGEPIYTFHLPRTKTYPHRVTRVNRKPSEYCDVMVLVGLEQGRFWVVPASLLDNSQALFMGPIKRYDTVTRKVSECEGAWDNILSFGSSTMNIDTLVKFPSELTKATVSASAQEEVGYSF